MDWIGDLGIAVAAVKIVDLVLTFIATNKILWLVTALPLTLWGLHVAPGKFKFSGRVRLGIMAAVVIYFLWAMVLFTIEQWRAPAPPRSPHSAAETPVYAQPSEVPREDRIGGP